MTVTVMHAEVSKGSFSILESARSAGITINDTYDMGTVAKYAQPKVHLWFDAQSDIQDLITELQTASLKWEVALTAKKEDEKQAEDDQGGADSAS